MEDEPSAPAENLRVSNDSNNQLGAIRFDSNQNLNPDQLMSIVNFTNDQDKMPKAEMFDKMLLGRPSDQNKSHLLAMRVTQTPKDALEEN